MVEWTALEMRHTGDCIQGSNPCLSANGDATGWCSICCIAFFCLESLQYVVGRNWPAGRDIVFCLDRIQDFRLSSHTIEYPEDFDPQEYFNGCIGVISGDGCCIEKVILKVGAAQANYLRDLPMHDSQQETENIDEYSIFELQVRPTFDFQQELLMNGDDIEVLEPSWLRKDIAGTIKRMWNKYKEDK